MLAVLAWFLQACRNVPARVRKHEALWQGMPQSWNTQIGNVAALLDAPVRQRAASEHGGRACAVGAGSARCSSERLTAAASRMAAVILGLPPQFGQRSILMAETTSRRRVRQAVAATLSRQLAASGGRLLLAERGPR